jgi:hypothetical protein
LRTLRGDFDEAVVLDAWNYLNGLFDLILRFGTFLTSKE